jgi:HlyD family secretion protein
VSATGTVQPVEQVEVGSQVSGTVLRLAADYNDRVRKGQVLCQLDPSSFRARAVQGEAAVARAEAALKDAKRAYTRAQDLIAQNYISQADVDAAEVAVEQRDAELKQARAQLDASQVDLANATIRSPIDGVVIARSIEVGQTVAASLQSPRLFVIANDLAQMQVETRIDEADIGKIAVDLPVRFNVDAFPEQTARRNRQSRAGPNSSHRRRARGLGQLAENPELKLRPE